MSDSEQGKETDSIQDQRLQWVLSARQKKTDEELKWLKHRRRVGEALELEYDHWAMIAVNLWEKTTAMLFEENEQSTNIIQSRVNSLDDQSELCDTVNFLMGKERRELQELEQRQLVLKSLQHSQHKFHKAALLLFGRNDLTTRSQIQKRSGNCLVTELQSEDVGIDPEIQNRVKKQSQSLVGAIFSVPSSKKRLHKELLKQTRQGFVKKRLTQSASHAPTSFAFDADSSSEISNTSSDRKIKKQKKKRRKINTLPYSRRNLSHSIPKKLLNSNHMNGIFKMYVPLNGKEDTLEELSEVESVSSTTTIVQLPTQVRNSVNHITAPSPLRASSRTPVIPETNNDKLVPDYDYSSNRIATDGNQPETKSDSITITTNGEEKESNEDLLTLSQFHGHETHSIDCLKPIPRPSVESIVEVTQSSGFQRQESSSSFSSTSSYNQSWSESSMSYSTSSFNTKSVEDDDDESPPLSSGLNNNDFEMPMLPPIPNCSTTFGIQTTMSWLDRYSDNADPPSRRLSQTDSTNNDCDSPEISDTYSTVASDPGLTPFITSDVHPLSDAFLESMNSMNIKWEGVNVPDRAWQDPGFREYSNTLSHEPTNDDVVVYKMLELSEEIEERFGNNLDKIISEACMLALKDQLSFISLHKLSQRLVLPVSEVKERIMLLTILGRNLWEKLPKFQVTIMEFTQEAVYSSMLDSGAGPDLSEITSDYDDWTSEVDTEELRRIILSENEPSFMASVESLTSNGDIQLPPYPPDSVKYMEYMVIPRPLIQRSKSIEVLFMEQAVMEPEPVKDKTPDKPRKFNPPRRTVSESSIVGEDDSRKTSMCSVFEPIYEDLRAKSDRRNNEGVDDTNVIIAENREDAWIHLKDIEHGKKDTLKRAVVLSTSSTDSVSSRTSSRPLQSSTQDSKDYISSISDIESTTDAGSDNQNPSKGQKIPMPVFDRINEETEHSANNSNNIAEVKYPHITMIKPTPAISDQNGGIDQDTKKDEFDDTDNGVTTPLTPPLGRRRSSAEILVDVAHPLLTISAPFIILVIGSLLKKS